MFSRTLLRMSLPAAALALTASGAEANLLCGDRDKIIAALSDKYHEDRQSMGIVGQDGKGVLEVFASDQGTWTILITSAKGATCVVAAGVNWQKSPEKLAGTGT